MRLAIKQFVKICVGTLPMTEPIYEFGSLQVSGQEGFADLRPLFLGKEYIGADIQKGLGVDKILNLHKINLPSESVGTVLILDTLEHVEFVRKAIKEAYRILKPNGILIISSVMNFAIHNFPHDYWRFTPEAFRSLLKPFDSSFVDFLGKSSFPHTIVGIGFKNPIPKKNMNKFIRNNTNWKKHFNRLENNWKELVNQFTPPILIDLYRKLRGN